MVNILKTIDKAAFIGLGLIGGSLARALRERTGIKDITAVDSEAASIRQALADGIISRGFMEINQYVYDADIVFICTPVKYTKKYLDALSGKMKSDSIVTDVGSTKAEVIEYVNNMENPPHFIGGHPMAGAEKAGYSAGFSHLFENAYYILTPSRTTHEAHLEILSGLIKAVGGIPVILDAREHDKITGTISHVPHVIASALVNLVEKSDSGDGRMQMLAAGGFKDITRIASSSPEMWESIISSNKLRIGEILDKYIEILNDFKCYIKAEDYKQVHGFFQSAKDFRDSFAAGSNKLTSVRGLIAPANEVIVDVVDKPGIIGEIATILGNNGVNIKNINVSNSREFEQGCLKITLSDSESVNIAFDLLCNKGYKIYKSN